MTNENKSSTFTNNKIKNLDKITFGRGFGVGISKTVPNAKKEKWEKEVGIDPKVDTSGKDKDPGGQVLVTSGPETQHAGRALFDYQSKETVADKAKAVVGPNYEYLKDPTKKLESNVRVNNVCVATPGGVIGGTVQQMDQWGITASVIGKKAGTTKPTKADRTETFLEGWNKSGRNNPGDKK
jgi:hypothetical protein